ncbi:hypothetical protein ACFLU6_09595 [Acidobacteriota bacterium]
MPRQSSAGHANKTTRYSYKVAGISFAVTSDDPALNLRPDQTVLPFVENIDNPDIHIKARREDLVVENRGNLLFDSGSLWKLYQANGSRVFWFHSPSLGTKPYKMASFTKDFKRGEVFLDRSYFAPNRPADPLEYPLDELIMVNLLARGRGAEIHSFGVVDDRGQGHLFVGQSGAGKSTMARIWDSKNVGRLLSDDRIILRRIDDTVWMYGTPWHGEAGYASSERAPLKNIYFLRQWEKNELVPLQPAETVGRLFGCSFPPFHDRKGLKFTIDFLEDIARSITCAEFRFVPDESALDILRI